MRGSSSSDRLQMCRVSEGHAAAAVVAAVVAGVVAAAVAGVVKDGGADGAADDVGSCLARAGDKEIFRRPVSEVRPCEGDWVVPVLGDHKCVGDMIPCG